MERRDYLTTVGGTVAASVLGVTGLAAMSGSAVAAVGNLDITDTSISNDTGDVTEIGVQLDHKVDFDGFDYPVAAAAYEDYIVQLNQDGSEYARHKLYDNTENPVMLENWSSFNGSDGWGGAGEYNTGPGTEGEIYADIDWTVIAENPQSGTQTPGDAADFTLDNPNDDSTKTRYFRYEKNVHLFGTRDNGTEGIRADDGTWVYKLGEDDGTVGVVESEGRFDVDVKKEEATVTSGTENTGDSTVS